MKWKSSNQWIRLLPTKKMAILTLTFEKFDIHGRGDPGDQAARAFTARRIQNAKLIGLQFRTFLTPFGPSNSAP